MSNSAQTTAQEPTYETIDCTPSWQWCAQVFIAVLTQKGNKGKDEAAKELMHMAEIAQAFADEGKRRGKLMAQNEKGQVYRKMTKHSHEDKYILELDFIDMHIITKALSHYRFMNSEYYNTSEGHRERTEHVAGLLTDLYCHDIEITQSPLQ